MFFLFLLYSSVSIPLLFASTMNDRNREGWVRVGEDWYMVSSDPMNWYEAQEVRIYFIYCIVHRGILC